MRFSAKQYGIDLITRTDVSLWHIFNTVLRCYDDDKDISFLVNRTINPDEIDMTIKQMRQVARYLTREANHFYNRYGMC